MDSPLVDLKLIELACLKINKVLILKKKPEHRTAHVYPESEFLHASLASSMVMLTLQSSKELPEFSSTVTVFVFVFVIFLSWSCTPVPSVDVATLACGC